MHFFSIDAFDMSVVLYSHLLEDVKSIGTSTAKAKYIKNAASAVLAGTLDFSQFPTMTDEAALAQLIQLPGIGMWTAKMYLIFVLDRQNILPFEDVAFLQSYESASIE